MVLLTDSGQRQALLGRCWSPVFGLSEYRGIRDPDDGTRTRPTMQRKASAWFSARPTDGLVNVNGGPGRLSSGERLELLGDFLLRSDRPARNTKRQSSRSSATTAPSSSSRFNVVWTSSAEASSSFSASAMSSSTGRPHCPSSIASRCRRARPEDYLPER